MPSMTDHEANKVVKAICLADSGTGKTGALAALVDAGYNVRVLDFDNGMSPIRGYVKDKSKLANVHYVTLRDELQLTGVRMGIKSAKAFQRAMELLDKGGDLWGAGSNIPKLTEWTEKDILVVDTLGMMGRSALLYVMELSNASMKNPEIQHYGIAMENIEKFIGQITSAAVPCNVIVNTHITSIEGTTKLYPDALGSKLGPKLGRYFDNMLTISAVGGKKAFKTKVDGALALKSAVALADSYPIEDGWVSIFKALLDKKTLP